jgi:hypothetical protein
MPPGREGSWDGRFAAPGRTPEGSCEALFPTDGRFTPEGRVDADPGTRPPLGRDAPAEGSCDGRETEPLDGRETFPVEGRETLPVEGREAGRETEPVEGRE